MQLKQKILGALTVFCLAGVGLVQANGLPNDAFVREATNRINFEPGGKYHLFGSGRGVVTDRKGNIAVLPVSSQNVGGLLLEQALINGNITYNMRFSGHEHDEHLPFANSRSRSESDTKGQALVGFTSYKLDWRGEEVHPADGYDGAQGSGYPAPTGARDEYTYNIKGNAARVEVQFDDNRSTLDRFKDRFSNAGDMLTNGLKNNWDKATTHNPNLNFWGNKAEIVNAMISGVGNITGAGFEVLGAGDVAQFAGSLKDVGTMEAIRAMPVEAQLNAVAGLTDGANTYDNSVANYEAWALRNPNTAIVAGVAINITKQTIGKGGSTNGLSVDDFSRKRPTSFRTDTIKDAWDNAEDGSLPNTKKCPTCGRDVQGNPHNKETRNTDDGWDVSHNPSWNNRDHDSYGSRKELLDDYNSGTGLECRHCNRSGQDNDERFNQK